MEGLQTDSEEAIPLSVMANEERVLPARSGANHSSFCFCVP